MASLLTDDFEFDIPESWRLAHLETVTNGVPSKQYQILESEVHQTGQFPVISQSKAYSIGLSDESGRVYHHEKPVIIFGDHTTEIKYVEFDFIVGADGVKIFEPVDKLVTARFLFYVLVVYAKDLSKVGGYSRHYKYIKNKPIPLPPLAEQKRIVAKIEELLPYLDRYEKAWNRLEDFNRRFPADMQKSILQMAIQGKLVDQRPEEGTGEELYRQIQTEKQALIKAGKIKKEKPLPEIAEDEVPFEIPEGWKWVRIQSISKKTTDGEHKTPRRVGAYCGFYLLSARNVRDGEIALKDVDYVDETEYKRIALRCNPQKGDVLISCSGSVGRCAVVENDNKYVMVRSAAMVSPVNMNSNYLMYAIRSEVVQEQIRAKIKQTAQANLFQEAIRNLAIPFPPLAEQKRIVARLEEILPLCERLK